MGRQTKFGDNLKPGGRPKQKADHKKPRIRMSRDASGKLYGWDDWRGKPRKSTRRARRGKYY